MADALKDFQIALALKVASTQELRTLGEALKALETLERKSQGQVRRKLRAAIELVQEVAPFFQDQAGEAEAVSGAITTALVHGLEREHDLTGVTTVSSSPDTVVVEAESMEIPRYPPDDDGEGDRDYWNAVGATKVFLTRASTKALTSYRRNIREISTEYAEKGFFHVTVRLR